MSDTTNQEPAETEERKGYGGAHTVPVDPHRGEGNMPQDDEQEAERQRIERENAGLGAEDDES